MKTKITLLFCISVIITKSYVFSQWTGSIDLVGISSWSICTKGSAIWTGTNYGVYVSTDEGGRYVKKSSGIPSTATTHELFVSGSTIFAMSDRGIFSSSDDGGSWQAKNTNLTNIKTCSMIEINNELYIGTYKGIYKSVDKGDNWNYVSLADEVVNVLRYNNGKLYAGTFNRVFISEDNGLTWVPTSLEGEVNTIVFNSNAIFVGFYNTSSIYKSVDGGNVFKEIKNTLSCNYINEMIVLGDKIIASADQGFMIFDITKETFSYENAGTSQFPKSIAVNGQKAYLGVINSGVLRRDLTQLGLANSVSVSENTILDFKVYPNPINDELNIELNNFENAKVEILNLKGDVVNTLLLKNQNTKISSLDLSAGIYVVKITNKEGVAFIKMAKE